MGAALFVAQRGSQRVTARQVASLRRGIVAGKRSVPALGGHCVASLRVTGWIWPLDDKTMTESMSHQLYGLGRIGVVHVHPSEGDAR